MTKQTKTLEQLKDSRLLYDKKIPAFGYMIVLATSALLIGVLVWSIYAPKLYIIIANGTVTSTNSTYVMPSYSGAIDQSFMEEGKRVSQGDVLFTVKSTDLNLQEEQLLENKASFEAKIQQYEKLVRSIKDDFNYFDKANPGDELYYSTFELYKAQIRQKEVDPNTYKAYGYSDEQIEAEIAKNQSAVEELYYGAIQSAQNAIRENESQIAQIDAQLSAVSSGQQAYAVTATISGTLHLLADYRPGMVVQAASSVATITPENEDTIIEAMVSAADMARMHQGDDVQIAVQGLTQTVYGTISGKVTQIDSNATPQQNQDGSTVNLFKLRILPDFTYLITKSGEKVNISNGMAVEARVAYDKVTYFNYVLDKLGFKPR